MKTIYLFLAFCLILLASGCKTENPTSVKPKILGLHEITDTTYINIPRCLQFPFYNWSFNQDSVDTLILSPWIDPTDTCYQLHYFVNDSSSYRYLYSIFYGGPCSLPVIDFNNYTLLGSFISGLGIPGYLTRKIYVNDSLRTCEYDINLIFTESIKIGLENTMNWVLIPKIPNDYTIKFNSKRIRQ